MCVHCLQSVGVASGYQNSLQLQHTGPYALPDEIFKILKVCNY